MAGCVACSRAGRRRKGRKLFLLLPSGEMDKKVALTGGVGGGGVDGVGVVKRGSGNFMQEPAGWW